MLAHPLHGCRCETFDFTTEFLGGNLQKVLDENWDIVASIAEGW